MSQVHHKTSTVLGQPLKQTNLEMCQVQRNNRAVYRAPCPFTGSLRWETLSAKVQEGFFFKLFPHLSLPCFQKWDWQRSSEGDCLVFHWSRPEVNTDGPVCLQGVAGKRWAKHSREGGMGALRKKKVVGIVCCSVSWGELTLWVASGFTCVPVKIK